MTTLQQFATGQIAIPTGTAWHLSDLGEYRGKQDLYTRQSPQRLKSLREHAMIQSAVSSNRIEGVAIDPNRVRDIFATSNQFFGTGMKKKFAAIATHWRGFMRMPTVLS